MNPKDNAPPMLPSRRRLLRNAASGLGNLALTSLVAQAVRPASARAAGSRMPGTDFAPKAKRAIWLFMGGGPSQLDMWDYKPGLASQFNQDLPDSVKMGQRVTGMTVNQARFPIAPSVFPFAQYGNAGTWVSSLLPNTAKLADDIAVVKTIQGDAINHEPAMLEMMTGSMLQGKPSAGAWVSYGLGALNENLPTFVVMTSLFSNLESVQALSSRLWGNAFLASKHAGVTVRGVGDPVLYLANPPGVDATTRRAMLDGLASLNGRTATRFGDAQIDGRIDQYELAFRMQSSVPELTDLTGESDATRDLYGPDVNRPGSFTSNCLMARRMLERGVRFVQIYHRGWDAHGNLPRTHTMQCLDIDRACYALVTDLKQRGLLDDTLVIWGGEFGRTVYGQGTLTMDNYGRDHHPRCFTMWMAGGGLKPGIVFGETDDFGYNAIQDPVPIRDLHATLLHQFGLDHNKLVVPYQGLGQKLVGVDAPANVVTGLLA
jgi:hypothetical protein